MSIGVRRFARWIGVMAFALLFQACTSLAYLPFQQTVGRLRTVGPNVYVNDKRARDGQMVRVTDHLRTGPSSSAFLYPLDGGLIQLDENTEPFFKLVWVNKPPPPRCRIVTLGLRVGQAYQETGHQCGTTVRTSHGDWTQQEIRNRISYRGPTE